MDDDAMSMTRDAGQQDGYAEAVAAVREFITAQPGYESLEPDLVQGLAEGVLSGIIGRAHQASAMQALPGYAEAVAGVSGAVRHAVRAGSAILEADRRLGHGWEEWARRELQMPLETAVQYMLLAHAVTRATQGA